MIVKNETAVILRCLESVRSFVSQVLIEDTGSTDGTQALIRNWLLENRIEGEVYDRPWIDFASNRSSVLARMRENTRVDYALVMDADDVFQIDDEAVFLASLNQLKSDTAKVRLLGKGIEFQRTQLVSNRKPFHYKGVLHEFIEGPTGFTVSDLQGCSIRANSEGARSQDPLKYQKDADLLLKALGHEKDAFLVSRYTFYLAQSLRDAGKGEEAIAWYLKRAEMGYWLEERYCALLYAGRLLEQQASAASAEEAQACFRRAVEIIPQRQEAFHALARHFRLRDQFAQAYPFALQGSSLTRPTSGLFLENWIYDYAMKDELAVVAYWCGDYQKSLEACLECLSTPAVNGDTRARVLKNADFARVRLQELLGRLDALDA